MLGIARENIYCVGRQSERHPHDGTVRRPFAPANCAQGGEGLGEPHIPVSLRRRRDRGDIMEIWSSDIKKLKKDPPPKMAVDHQNKEMPSYGKEVGA